jgi:hypothetical protein
MSVVIGDDLRAPVESRLRGEEFSRFATAQTAALPREAIEGSSTAELALFGNRSP